MDQSDLEFLIPEDSGTFVDPDIKLYIRGKFTKSDVRDVDARLHGRNKQFSTFAIQSMHRLSQVSI